MVKSITFVKLSFNSQQSYANGGNAYGSNAPEPVGIGLLCINTMPKKGYKQSKQHRLNGAAARKGYKHTEESLEKISRASIKTLERWHNENQIKCSSCGDLTSKKGARQFRCPECSIEEERRRDAERYCAKKPTIRTCRTCHVTVLGRFKRVCPYCQSENKRQWMRNNKKSTSKKLKLRFLVLSRDKFTCVYCGRRPPEVTLELDHITPKKTGGLDIIDNLNTSCRDCNGGKGDVILI